jgi:hypothetical protein
MLGPGSPETYTNMYQDQRSCLLETWDCSSPNGATRWRSTRCSLSHGRKLDRADPPARPSWSVGKRQSKFDCQCLILHQTLTGSPHATLGEESRLSRPRRSTGEAGEGETSCANTLLVFALLSCIALQCFPTLTPFLNKILSGP